MHTLNPTKLLLILATMGLAGGAILTSSLQDKRVAFGNSVVTDATKGITVVRTGIQGQHLSAWQRLKSNSEGQIRDNEKKIGNFKANSAKTSKTFRITYDQRVAELERRNIALKGKLNDFKGDRGETRVVYK